MSIIFPKKTKRTPKKMRYVGMEIECITEKSWKLDHNHDYDDDDRYDGYYQMSCLGTAKKFVLNIHDDGSVEGKGYPAEVVTQPLLESRNRAIKSICNTIKKRGGYVNKSCGGHIHIDAKDIKTALRKTDNSVLAVKFLTLCEPALYAVTGKNRLKNSFCLPLTAREETYPETLGVKIWNTSDMFADRYNAINFCALDQYGTLEFRLFAGTLEHEKWIARAALAEAVVNKLASVLKNPKLLNKLHKQSELSGLTLDEVIDVDFDKPKLYKDLIATNGVKLIEGVSKMIGLHSKYKKILIQQHKEIWGAYAKKDIQ